MHFFVYIVAILSVFLFYKFVWLKRWHYFHSSKIPGPFWLPLIGTTFSLTIPHDAFFKTVQDKLKRYMPVCKLWFGSELYICTMRPEDLEVILTTCLNKGPFYEIFHDYINNSLMTAEVNTWKRHRKIIGPSFSQSTLNSFHKKFVKHSKEMVAFLEKNQGKEYCDLINQLWKRTLDIVTETLGNVDLNLIPERYENISCIEKIEKIVIERFHKFWLLSEHIFKLSPLFKKTEVICAKGRVLAQNVLLENEKRSSYNNEMNDVKHFVPYLLKMEKSNIITRNTILEETVNVLLAGSETTALTSNLVLLILGLYPEIQEKVFEEIASVLHPLEKDLSLEDMFHLKYLGCVIKESMRICPIVPFILRKVDEDLKLDPFVYPAGCNIAIPICFLHKDPTFWPEPDKFDPDRFLEENAKSRHKCAYIPFSYGPRNCIGYKYGMMALKVILATILKEFKVTTVSHQKLEDVEFDFFIVLKPKNCRLVFEKRSKQ